MKIAEILRQKFTDFVYRHTYAEEFLDSYIATQIKVLREQRGLSQIKLAELLHMTQSQVARMESVNHSGWQIRTLKRVARAFDLSLVVKFESFGNVLPEITGFGRSALQRPSFDDDPLFNAPVVAVGEEHIPELPEAGSTGSWRSSTIHGNPGSVFSERAEHRGAA